MQPEISLIEKDGHYWAVFSISCLQTKKSFLSNQHELSLSWLLSKEGITEREKDMQKYVKKSPKPICQRGCEFGILKSGSSSEFSFGEPNGPYPYP